MPYRSHPKFVSQGYFKIRQINIYKLTCVDLRDEHYKQLLRIHRIKEGNKVVLFIHVTRLF